MSSPIHSKICLIVKQLSDILLTTIDRVLPSLRPVQINWHRDKIEYVENGWVAHVKLANQHNRLQSFGVAVGRIMVVILDGREFKL